MKILLAGPGTGKTTNIKAMIKNNYPDAKNILVLSFTHATVNDLTKSFLDNPSVRCNTLHSYALIINHLNHLYILEREEAEILVSLAKKFEIEINQLFDFFRCTTFDRMITSCVEFLGVNPVYAKEKIGELDLFIVDEFQDFNLIERGLIQQISTFAKETIILGDDDQSIYGFKDADPEGIIELFNQPAIERIPHENICHRCPDKVVEASRKLIAKNKNRIQKEWKTGNVAGDIFFHQILTQDESNQFLLEQIKTIRKSDPNKSILVLSPIKHYVQKLITQLREEEIPLVDFWKDRITSEERYQIWWLRAIFSQHKLLHMIFLANTTLTAHFKKKFNDILLTKLKKNFDESNVINETVDCFKTPLSEYLIQAPQITDFFKIQTEFAMFEKFFNFEDIEASLKSILSKFNPQVEFDITTVNFMSIHKSKGLQAEYVFMTGVVDGVLPRKINGIDAIESQRRVLFVGMTRARKQLHIISEVEWEGKVIFGQALDRENFDYDHRKKIYNGQASPFISDMS